MRYFLTIAYEGSAYAGWQRQKPPRVSVQGTLEEAFSTFLGTKISLVGGSRTDAGVHALAQSAHMDTLEPLDVPRTIQRLNRMLPATIALTNIQAVHKDAHARYDALSRSYRYAIHTAKNPLLNTQSLYVPYPLNWNAIQRATQQLPTISDFHLFCKQPKQYSNHVCQIAQAEWEQLDPHSWHLHLTANRFLQGMVRAIVGALVAIGKGKKLTLLKGPKSPLAHPSGLCLMEVRYPNHIYL